MDASLEARGTFRVRSAPYVLYLLYCTVYVCYVRSTWLWLWLWLCMVIVILANSWPRTTARMFHGKLQGSPTSKSDIRPTGLSMVHTYLVCTYVRTYIASMTSHEPRGLTKSLPNARATERAKGVPTATCCLSSTSRSWRLVQLVNQKWSVPVGG